MDKYACFKRNLIDQDGIAIKVISSSILQRPWTIIRFKYLDICYKELEQNPYSIQKKYPLVRSALL